MPINFTCKCRKKLTAKDEYAGRKMKCSSCGAIVPIPAAKKAAAKSPARPLVSVGASKARTPPIAKPVAKPAPAPFEDDDEDPIDRPATKPQIPALFDTTQEQHATPWSRGDKKRFGPPPESEGSYLVMVLLLLVLAGAGGGAAWYLS